MGGESRTEQAEDGVSADVRIARLARGQHGVVARRQLLERGITARQIDRRVAAGLLLPIHRGVYLVGHASAVGPSRSMAAVLACGPGAALSHLSAGILWELLNSGWNDGNEWVTTSSDVIGGTGIRLRRAGRLAARDRRTRNGIPVTSPPRTLLDLAALIDAEALEGAVASGYARGLAGPPELRDQLDRNPRKRGRGALRALLDRDAPPALTLSVAERRLLALIRRRGLPEPEVNARVEGLLVDFLWRSERVIAELDGYAYHSDVAAFQRDRERTNRLQLLGYVVLRFTWRDLIAAPDAVVARLREALQARSARG